MHPIVTCTATPWLLIAALWGATHGHTLVAGICLVLAVMAVLEIANTTGDNHGRSTPHRPAGE